MQLLAQSTGRCLAGLKENTPELPERQHAEEQKTRGWLLKLWRQVDVFPTVVCGLAHAALVKRLIFFFFLFPHWRIFSAPVFFLMPLHAEKPTFH